MRIPESLAPLVDYGIVQDVVRPLMSGKEAQVYIVVSGGKYCVAKVYKEAQNRTFKHRAEYTEGRKVRNTRDQRAIGKRSKHGRAQDEAAWRSTEVDTIRRLHSAGVRVPVPEHFIDGVLIMELILDADGNPAPRLADLVFEPAAAQAMYERLIQEVLRMLCAGVVHGDLSDFNVLIGADGPVIIDFPQSVDTAHNANARKLLLRDVDNLHRFLFQFAPKARRLPYAEEMWELFQQNALTPETRLLGRYRPSERRADPHAVLELIRDANYDERKRRESLGLRGGPPVGDASPGRPEARPAPPSRDGRPWRGPPPQNAQPRSGPGPGEPGRHERRPNRPAPQGPPQNRAPQNGQNGPRNPGTSGGGAPTRAGDRGRRFDGHGAQRDERRPVEVIVARRPTTPR
jgi:RIO kinase 1